MNATTLLLLVLFLGGLLPNALLAQTADTLDVKIENPMDVDPEVYRILGVKVTGVQTYEPSFIATFTQLEEGMELVIPSSKISDAIKRLYRTGLFSDVKILITQKIRTGVFLEIQVKEQPRLDSYEIEGVKRGERRDLKDKLTLLPGFAVTESTKAQAISTIKRFFTEKGYRGTEVSVSFAKRDTARNRVQLNFSVKKGERLEVKEIAFTGNEKFKTKRLKKQLKDLREDAWWKIFGKTTFKKDEFEEGKENLMAFYRKNGFRDVRITSDTVYVYDYKKGKQGIRVLINLEEGPQYRFRNLYWEGNTVYTDEQLTRALGFKKGDLFNEELFEQNLSFNKNNTDVTSMYQDAGYLFSRIEPDFVPVPGDSLDIYFYIVEDEIATINLVNFSGNTRTHDDVVRRNLRTVPGEQYARSKITRSLRELATLGYFVPESLNPQLDPDFEKKSVNINYSMKENTGTDNFEFSGGFGGLGIGLILSARVNFNNFSIQNVGKEEMGLIPTGDGQRLSLGVQVTGGGFQMYDLGFQEPWFMGRPHTFGVNLSYSLFKTRDSRQEMLMSAISYGRRLSFPDDYFQQTFTLSFQKYNVFGGFFFLDNVTGDVFVMSLRHTIERNSLDNFISPNSGSRISFSQEAAPPVGIFSQYWKIRFKYQHHTPVVGKLVFTHGLEYGQLGFFGTRDRIPFERFFLGGTPLQQRQVFTRDNVDLKGYPGGQGGSISPIIDNIQAGGTIYNKFFTEMRYPAVSNEQLQLIPYVFAEGGNAYLNFRTFDPFNINRSAGFGVRLFLPILGLIDLSYGYRFDGIPNTLIRPNQWEFLFNIGAPF